jgi:hypothetical protein
MAADVVRFRSAGRERRRHDASAGEGNDRLSDPSEEAAATRALRQATLRAFHHVQLAHA